MLICVMKDPVPMFDQIIDLYQYSCIYEFCHDLSQCDESHHDSFQSDKLRHSLQ
jgi:hypothetical protein